MQTKQLLAKATARLSAQRSRLKATHHLGQLSRKDVGKEVVLTGWLAQFRERKENRAFVQLKDSHARVQVVVQELPDRHPRASGFNYGSLSTALSQVNPESVISVRGHVQLRGGDQSRPTNFGDLEVVAEEFELVNEADATLPFYPSHSAIEKKLPNPELRFEHRYLDLRRESVAANIKLRSKVMQTMRKSLLEEDFVEVETPILLRSSPEGAREFLVPVRTSSSSLASSTSPLPSSSSNNDASSDPSSPSTPTLDPSTPSPSPQFYALAQSPQQPKQLLIASGSIPAYFQFARCFRDEDGRKDRQPEFTQVDMERAFVSWDPDVKADVEGRGWRIGGMEVRDSVERMIGRVWKGVNDVDVGEIRVVTYQDAMGRYGSDKPDTRAGYEIAPLESIIQNSEFATSLRANRHVDCLVIKADDEPAQRAIRDLKYLEGTAPNKVECFKVGKSGQLPWSKMHSLQESLQKGHDISGLTSSLEPGDVIFLHARKGAFQGGATPLGAIRLALISRASSAHGLELPSALYDPHFLWVTEFPLFTRADDDKDAFLAHGRWSSSHHPFTAPVREDLENGLFKRGEYASIRGQHYDLVLNGMEIGGGSVRIHDADLQEYVFREVLQLSETEVKPFETLLRALRSGAPPHGGIALGFDRLMTILCGVSSIKDVIAFPKSLGGMDPLFKSPSGASDEVLKEYGLRRI